MMAQTSQLNQTSIIQGKLLDVVQRLLSNGWRKKKDNVFFRNRNTYSIELDGSTHPLWKVIVTPKTDEFDSFDWKLRQDLNSLKVLGQSSNKKLYLNDENKEEIGKMISALQQNRFNLIYDNKYLMLRTRPNSVRVFKIAASMELVEQRDGWYVGEKKVL